MERATFSVPNIECENCARTIRRSVSGATGVQRVEVDVPKKQVSIEYDPDQITVEAVCGQLERSGFPPAEGLEKRRIPAEPAGAAPAGVTPAPRATRSLWYWLLALGVAALALAGYIGYVLYPRFGLPAAEGATLLFLATGAGIASFFSPCSFPLLVTLLARQTGVEMRRTEGGLPLGRVLTFAAALSLGAAAFLLLSGLVIAAGGAALFAAVTFASTAGRIIRTIVGLLLIVLGLIQVGALPFSLHAVEHIARPLMQAQARYRRQSPVVGFTILGFAYLLAGFG